LSRTKKAEPFNIYSKEKKTYRGPWLKKLRRRAKMDLTQGKEPPPRERRTSGWLTW
jgi:hypothetical protein